MTNAFVFKSRIYSNGFVGQNGFALKHNQKFVEKLKGLLH